MNIFFKISGGLVLISALLSAYLFRNPTAESFMPHWVLPIISFISLVILLGAERGPKPKQRERGFGAVLIGLPLLAILFQLNYMSADIGALSFLSHDLVPIMGLHVFFGAVGNYVTTSKSLLSGLPTPWNMRSEMSWRKSHRLLGYGFVLLALVSACASLIKGTLDRDVLAIGIIVLLCLFAVYSWWIWRNDPNRRSLHGVQ